MTYTSYGRKPFDIAGYSYQADLECPACMATRAKRWLSTGSEQTDGLDPESLLDLAAARIGLDRMDERTFDSGDFPKVVFVGSLEPQDYGDGEPPTDETCGICGEEL